MHSEINEWNISFTNLEQAKSVEISPGFHHNMYYIFNIIEYVLCSDDIESMHNVCSLQYNIIVRAYFVEAYYNRVWDWWFGQLLHDTDQPREIMLSTALRLWSVLSISLSWSVSCNSDHITSLKPLSNDWLTKMIWIFIKLQLLLLLSHVIFKVTFPKYDEAS